MPLLHPFSTLSASKVHPQHSKRVCELQENQIFIFSEVSTEEQTIAAYLQK
jgi:hypothetical protein